MNERIKKTIIIILFAGAVIGLGYLMYYFFFKPPQAALPPGNLINVNTPAGQLPELPEGNVNRVGGLNVNAGLPFISQIPEDVTVSETANGSYTLVNNFSSSRVVAPTVNQNGGVNYFNSAEGRFYKINADGSVSQLTDQRFYAVQNITWAPKGNSAVLEYPDGSNIVYDFVKKQQYALPKELEKFSFSTDAGQLAAAAIGPQEENNWIVTANPDGSNIQFVERLGAKSADVDINWSPNGQMVAMYRKNTGNNAQEVIFIGRNQENFQSLTVNGHGFKGKWSAKGDRLLYSVYRTDNDFKPILQSVQAGGDNAGAGNLDLGLATWPEKCALAADGITAYCGVPDYLPSGSGLYPQLAKNSADAFYKVDLQTGQISVLATPVGDLNAYSASNVSLSPDEKTLFFQDANNGKVYSIKL
ncbi:MAG: hypothetical protein Q8P32_03745 [Candidatus Komeilibacteria bacterium]|nr:hypothetical protein [Candidatus Komeilibacteria bacterium]